MKLPNTRWVPIRSLTPRHRTHILAHLLALTPRDRYLRFGHAVSDALVRKYVDGLDFDRDEIFGVFDRRLKLIATAHLAYPDEPLEDVRSTLAEFGVSVAATARGRGYGRHLFGHAVMHARNRGTDRLLIHALTENKVMLHIARAAGATVHREGTESEAWLLLPPDTLSSQLEALMESQAAEINYQLKRQALWFEQVMDAVGDVRPQLDRQREGGGV